MTYIPPSARMRKIIADAPARPSIVQVPEPIPEAAPEPEPANVEEALAAAGVEPEVAPEPAEEVKAEAEPEVAPEPAEEAEEASMELSRKELNELAATLGIEEADKLPNKQAVIDAIQAR